MSENLNQLPPWAEDAPSAPTPTLRVRVKAVPNAKQDQIAGALGDRLKIRVAAPPEGGKANDAIARVLAEYLGVHVRDVVLESGATSPGKVFLVRGASLPAG